MKGFKKASALLLASAITATVGIGAVSFAKWQASTSKSVDVNLGKYEYDLTYDSDATLTAPTDALVPYDQGDDSVVGAGKAKSVSLNVPKFTTKKDFDIGLKLNAAVAGAELYAVVVAKSTAVNVPTGAVTGDTFTDGSLSWKKLSASTVTKFTGNSTTISSETSVADGDYVIYVIMVSEGLGVAVDSFNLIVSLEARVA